MASVDTFNDSNHIRVNQHSSYPINVCSSALDDIDDDATVIISNVSSNKHSRKSFKAQALNHLVKTKNAMFAGLRLDTYTAIADSGATQFFCDGQNSCRHQTSNNTPAKGGVG